MMESTQILSLLALFFGAYLVASVNFSIVAARILKKGDLRTLGSKNAGATNLSRVAGKPVAALVLIMDIGRATGVVLVARAIAPSDLGSLIVVPFMLGNIFPVFHGFKGGKGVAAATGLLLAISPLSMLCGGGVFLLVLGIGRRVSPGSILMVSSYPAWIWLFGNGAVDIAAFAVVATIIILTHRGNIGRISRGQEPPLFGAGSRESAGGTPR